MNKLDTSDDSIWASVTIPIDKDALIQFCHYDVERLFRINPFIELDLWTRYEENRYRIKGRNISQQEPYEFDWEVGVTLQTSGLCISYPVSSLKQKTSFSIEEDPQGSKLTITDCYSSVLSDTEKKERLGEVDRSLPIWAKDIHQYLINWKKWSGLALWRWYMRKMWLPMKPSARRVAYMLLWISVVEVVLILLGASFYILKYS